MKKLGFAILLICPFLACNNNNTTYDDEIKMDPNNQIVIKDNGDSLEVGFWEYNNSRSAVIKKGYYENGFKTKEWNYIFGNNFRSVRWEIFKKENIEFNYPDFLKIDLSSDYPVLFLGDIEDEDKNTYIALLKYDMKERNSSISDYLYQVNKSRDNNSIEVLKSKVAKKYEFKNVDIFKYSVEIERDSLLYESISYIFEVNNILFDLTFKNLNDQMGSLDYEIFNDMLYSFKYEGKDLFTLNTGKYIKEVNIDFD